ncbi:MAG: ABC-F family ATP-binding cassette domain-containing protein, partial [Clostridia bacterium]|nr:ABC-F family ATP-binding cassette domain-containing protein [Clostridia bacterium]
VGVLKQNAEYDSQKSLLDELLDSFSHLQEMEAELKSLQERIDAGEGELSSRFSALHDRFMEEGGFEYKGRCASTLKSLGFSEKEQAMTVSAFSGGQKTRVALAKVLSQMPDLLILDEPTNHLDLKALTWLEDFLRSYPKTVIVVSHDRYFLDRVTTKTVEIEHGKIRVYCVG